MIIFVGCGKSKSVIPCIAERMYVGNYFTTCMKYARSICGKNDTIYILSAKHGVLPLQKVIQPYNETLNDFSESEYAVWLDMVVKQLRTLNIQQNESVVFLCGKNYYKGLINYFTNYTIPLEQFEGMGYQIQYMQKCIRSKTMKKLF